MPLDPWIIEEIRRREEEERQRKEQQQPQIEIIEPPAEESDKETPSQDDGDKDRGVVIINPDGSEERDKGSKAYGTVIYF